MLAGCLLHGPRARVHERPGAQRALARAPARGAGRARPARAPARTSCRAPAARSAASAARSCAPATRWLDLRDAPRRARLRRAARREPPRRRVLAVGVERPGSLMPAARAELLRSRHAVDVVTAPQGERGKFENLNALLAAHPPAAYDWLLVIDDDVALPRGFLDAFLWAAERTGLKLAQPAHRLHSHAAWPVTRRHPGATVRETTFVEIGPVTAFHRDSFDVLLPFPEGLRMGWGLDVHWAAVAAQHGWPIGIVDATPDRPHAAAGGQRLRARRGRGRGARVPGRPALRAPGRGPHRSLLPVRFLPCASPARARSRSRSRSANASVSCPRHGGRFRSRRRRGARCVARPAARRAGELIVEQMRRHPGRRAT